MARQVTLLVTAPIASPITVGNDNMHTRRKRVLRFTSILLAFALFATSCGGDSSDSGNAVDTEDVGLAPGIQVVDGQGLNAEGEVITAVQAPEGMFSTPTPVANAGPVDPWEVRVLTAKSDTYYVPTFREPGGESFTLEYEYLDGSTIEYPLVNPTYFGNDLALLVLEGEPGDDWAKVQLPIRPNGSTAWVQAAFFDWSSHNYHIEVDLAGPSVRVWEGTNLIVESDAVAGREDRPTPVLRTYIDEKIEGPSEAYGTWIMSLASYSESITTFSGGLPKLAMHGTNKPELIGEYVSSGCIRVTNEIIEIIAERVPVGATVDIIDSRL